MLAVNAGTLDVGGIWVASETVALTSLGAPSSGTISIPAPGTLMVGDSLVPGPRSLSLDGETEMDDQPPVFAGSVTLTWAEYVRALGYRPDPHGRFRIDGYAYEADGSFLLRDTEPVWFEFPAEEDEKSPDVGALAPEIAPEKPDATAAGENAHDRTPEAEWIEEVYNEKPKWLTLPAERSCSLSPATITSGRQSGGIRYTRS
jgi:hypothetical protein